MYSLLICLRACRLTLKMLTSTLHQSQPFGAWLLRTITGISDPSMKRAGKLFIKRWLNEMQWLHSFRYKNLVSISLTKKTEAGPKQKGLCSHCSSWPPTKGPLEKHSPWNDQATSPPRLCRPTGTAGPNTSCPSPKRLSNSLNTLITETVEETGACYSAAS